MGFLHSPEYIIANEDEGVWTSRIVGPNCAMSEDSEWATWRCFLASTDVSVVVQAYERMKGVLSDSEV